MKTGRLCASVTAVSCDEVMNLIAQAQEVADLIEIRFDHLPQNEATHLVRQLHQDRIVKPLIATYRPENQCGGASNDRSSRIRFWERLDGEFWAIDQEEDIFGAGHGGWNRILSHHDFIAGADEACEVFERLMVKKPAVVKLAYMAHDITDTVPVWKILKSAEEASQPTVAIAMGEPGKITRILGPAYGAQWTYCSVGPTTAPGQMSADDITHLYRAPSLTRKTRVYGVIGNPVSQSLSPRIHNAAFDHTAIDSVFIPLLVKDLRGFMRRMVRPASREVDLNFAGFAVTMPHKLEIMEYLDEIDETARVIGAVNTVKIDGDVLKGYNTDAEGFIDPLMRKLGSLKGARVAVFGAGGAARACIYALMAQDAAAAVFARDVRKGSELADEFGAEFFEMEGCSIGSFDIVVNATPIGMAGNGAEQMPFDLGSSNRGIKLVYDLVTSSGQTPLIRAARAARIETITGVEMLIAQAVRQFEIWTGTSAPISVMENAVIN